MPRGDGTGPQDKGSGSGRGLGKCIEKTKADATKAKGPRSIGTAGRGFGQQEKVWQGKR